MDEGVVTTLPWRQATYQLYYILYISTTSRGTFFGMGHGMGPHGPHAYQ